MVGKSAADRPEKDQAFLTQKSSHGQSLSIALSEPAQVGAALLFWKD
jgi:hypothetical protein